MNAKICDRCRQVLNLNEFGTISAVTLTVNKNDLETGRLHLADFCDIGCLTAALEDILKELKK